MRLFKSIKRKAGNAILPVVGTILGLTILAGTIVGVAVNSNKIVYKDSNLQKQKNGKEILYIASKYYSELLNDESYTPHAAADEVEAIFEFLDVRKKTVDGETRYMLYYPVDEDARRAAGSAEAYTGQWYRAIIQLQEKKSDDAHDKDETLGNELFSRDAKLDELYNVGNLMSTYLIDEGLLPAREYGLYQISTIESDIDTFDEVFKYVNNSGVIEIDDIAVALYGFQSLTDSSKIVSIESEQADGTEAGGNYVLAYNLGNLGGNYYWDDGKGSTHTSRIYRQEYDAEFLVGMMEYLHPEYDLSYDTYVTSTIYNTLSYVYDEAYDKHTVIAKGYALNGTKYNYTNTVTWEFNSTIEFADAMSEYVFWKNIDRLALYLNDVKTKLNADANRKWNNGAKSYSYKWTDDGLTVYTWRNSNCTGGYWDWPYTISEVDSFIVSCGYTDDGTTVSSQKVYEKLLNRESIIKQIKYGEYEEVVNNYTSSDVLTICNTANGFSTANNQSIRIPSYHYVPTERGYERYEQDSDSTKTQSISYVVATNDFSQAVLDYLCDHLYDKYETQNQKIDGNDVKLLDDSEKLIGSCQFQMVGDKVQISYHFNALKMMYEKEEKTYIDTGGWWSQRVKCKIYRYEFQNFYSGSTGDNLYLTVDEFKETFKEAIIEYYFDAGTIEIDEQIINQQIKVTRNELKEALVDPIRYNYLPNTILSEIVGDNSDVDGMKESTIALKLLSKFIELNKQQYSSMESMTITSTNIQNSTEFGGCFKYTINFKVNGSINASTVLYFKYMTNSGRNTHNINDSLVYTAGELNRNFDTITKDDGTVVRKFYFVPILDKNGNTLQVADLDNFAICGVMPYQEQVDASGNQIGAKVTLDGTEYTVINKNNINLLKNVDKNYFYNGDIEDLGQRDFHIKVKSGCTLIINGKLNLLHNQTLELEDGAMILINGDFLTFYEFNGKGNDSTDNNGVPSWSSSWTSSQINWFKQHGVNIKAGNAKIMVNGNMTYRGYKARYSTSNNYSRFGVNIDLVFDQTTFAPVTCSQSGGHWTHSSQEARSLLSGIFIINGDVKFESWAEYSNSDATTNQKQYMYRNSYSNPLINATFYVDGTFNMEGLYMSGLYDECRANFIFAKSIVQPTIALNSTLTRWGQNNNQYGNWQDTNGYLFMICEDAMDFSQVNFACVNLFTPYSQLLQSIDEHNESATNFSDFIEREAFMTMYPDVSVVNSWGLSSLLKQGFEEMYDPNDIGAITVHDHIEGDDV